MVFLLHPNRPSSDVRSYFLRTTTENPNFSHEHPMLAAEFRNTSLFFIVQRDPTMWFDALVNDYEESFQTDKHISLEVSWYSKSLTHKVTSTNWPLLRIRPGPRHDWLYVGLKSFQSNQFGLLTQDIVQTQLNSIQHEGRQNYWPGQNLWVGGINSTFALESGMLYPGLHSLSGTRRGFVGCLLSVKLNQVDLDLRSAFESRQRASGTTALDRVMQVGCLKSQPVAEDSTCEGSGLDKDEFPGIVKGRFCPNGGKCLPNWKRAECDCTETTYTGRRCEQLTPFFTFDGRQLIHLRFPTLQLSEIDTLSFGFQTPQYDVILLHTYAELIGQAWFSIHKSEYVSRRNRSRSVFDILDTEHIVGLELAVVRGRIQVRYNLGADPKVLDLPWLVSDGKWHMFSLYRRHQLFVATMDGQEYRTNLSLKTTILPLRGAVLGSKEYSTSDFLAVPVSESFISTPNFIGSMKQFSLNGLKLDPRSTSNELESLIDLVQEATSSVTLAHPAETIRPLTPAYPVHFTGSGCNVGIILSETKPVLEIQFAFKASRNTSMLCLFTDDHSFPLLILSLRLGRLKVDRFENENTHLSDFIGANLNNGSWFVVRLYGSSLGSLDIGVATYTEGIGGMSSILKTGYVPEALKDLGSSAIKDLDTVAVCIGDIRLGGNRPMDLHYYIRNKYSTSSTDYSSCLAEIKPGCADDVAGNCGTLVQESSPSSFHYRSLPILRCLHDGVCVRRWQSYACTCVGTTFRGDLCEQPETTVLFGSPKTPDSSGNGVMNSTSTLLLDEEPEHSGNPFGYIVVSIPPWMRYSTDDHVVLGMQVDDNHTVLMANRILTLYCVATGSDWMHVYLDSGQFHVALETSGFKQTIQGPSVQLTDGYYHRVSCQRSRNRIIIKVDKYFNEHLIEHDSTEGSLHTSKRTEIWIGHCPRSNLSDFYIGYLTGFAYNGLNLLDDALDITHYHHVSTARYGQVNRASSFKPRFPKAKVEEKSQTHLALMKQTAISSSENIFMGSLSYHQMSIRGDSPFAPNTTVLAVDHYAGQGQIIKSTDTLDNSLWTGNINMHHGGAAKVGLLTSLTVVAAMLLTLSVVFIYRYKTADLVGACGTCKSQNIPSTVQSDELANATDFRTPLSIIGPLFTIAADVRTQHPTLTSSGYSGRPEGQSLYGHGIQI
ncbi:unnamed protein product [Dicrocoelium dendriticum]|nr:unnamed protein product [Dicrocoelium dendriticum]